MCIHRFGCIPPGGPAVTYLSVSRCPDLIHIPQILFNRGSIGEVIQVLLLGGVGISSEKRLPAKSSFTRTTRDMLPTRRIGCQERFVELGDRLSIPRAFHGLPTSNWTSALGQADLVWSIFRGRPQRRPRVISIPRCPEKVQHP